MALCSSVCEFIRFVRNQNCYFFTDMDLKREREKDEDGEKIDTFHTILKI